MDLLRVSRLVALMLICVSFVSSRNAAAQEPPAPDDGPAPAGPVLGGGSGGNDQAEVLTRGPVHEAFAETVTFDPTPGVIATKAPPDTIEEVPPDQKPDGANVAWVPGYWAWDDEQSEFLWVSGIWRDLPPGRQWVPGYWNEAGNGFQWISGYWADAQQDDIDYLPEPPATVEAGPNVEAPSADYVWIPGCWIWYHGRYAWRPGYWDVAQPDWIWIPAHYVWTPRGWIFVNGYYDYSVARRGVLFAPVRFGSPFYMRRGYYYSPATVISLSLFTDHLFLRPRCRHYYFGDYYATNYVNLGFYPWFSFYSARRHNVYEPIFVHQRWSNRRDAQWLGRVEGNFKNRRDHIDARPPRTFVAMNNVNINKNNVKSVDKSRFFATSFDQMVKSKDTNVKFRPLGKDERKQIVTRDQDVKKFRGERKKFEANLGGAKIGTPRDKVGETKIKLPKSPIVSKPPEQLGKFQPPKGRDSAKQPDLNVQPKARKPTEKPDMKKQQGENGSPKKLDKQPNKIEIPKAKPIEQPKKVIPPTTGGQSGAGTVKKKQGDNGGPKSPIQPQPKIETTKPKVNDKPKKPDTSSGQGSGGRSNVEKPKITSESRRPPKVEVKPKKPDKPKSSEDPKKPN